MNRPSRFCACWRRITANTPCYERNDGNIIGRYFQRQWTKSARRANTFPLSMDSEMVYPRNNIFESLFPGDSVRSILFHLSIDRNSIASANDIFVGDQTPSKIDWINAFARSDNCNRFDSVDRWNFHRRSRSCEPSRIHEGDSCVDSEDRGLQNCSVSARRRLRTRRSAVCGQNAEGWGRDHDARPNSGKAGSPVAQAAGIRNVREEGGGARTYTGMLVPFYGERGKKGVNRWL